MADTGTEPLMIGIDLGKNFFDVHIESPARKFRFPNTPEGHAALIGKVGGLPVAACVFEATGHYGRDLHKALYAAGLPTMQVNPRQAAFFLKSRNPSHKTDRSDAQALCEMSRAMPLRITPPPSAEQEALREAASLRQSLVVERTAHRGRLEALATPQLKGGLQKIVEALDAEIRNLDALLDETVDANPALSAKQDIILSMPGIGVHSARAILAFLPELGALDGKQVAALAGVAPRARDSGSFKGRRSIHGGRAELRNILYMAALTAMRCNPVIKNWVQQNGKAAKPHKVIRIAVVRKLLVVLNAMVKNQTHWRHQA